MSKKNIVGFQPIILCGVNLSGRKFISKLISNLFPKEITIARKFTSIKSLGDGDNSIYYYLDKNELSEIVKETNSYLMLNIEKDPLSNSIDYITYLKEPIQEIIISKKVCLLSIGYNDIQSILDNGILNANFINIIPLKPELLAEKIFDYRYSYSTQASNEGELDKIYKKVYDEVEYSRKQIVKFEKSNLFSAQITNTYEPKEVEDQICTIIKTLYPFCNNKI